MILSAEFHSSLFYERITFPSNSTLENMYEQNKYHIQLHIGRMCCLQLFDETYKELHLIDLIADIPTWSFWTVRSVPHPEPVEYTTYLLKYVSGREVQLRYVNRVKLQNDEAILSFKISFSGKLRI